jgi:hypothetical protein
MNALQEKLHALPTHALGGRPHLSCRAVTDCVAASLYPQQEIATIDVAAYQRVLETTDALCRALGYQEIVKLLPPDVPLAEMGLYWTTAVPPAPAPEAELPLIHAGPGVAEMLAAEQLLDARLHGLGLAEVSRQHFKIPVTASDEVVALLQRAVASPWPNDYRGVWHDILGMCITSGRDVSATKRQFTVIIRGVGRRRYWRFQAEVRQEGSGGPYLFVSLVDENPQEKTALFPLGQVVMTPGVAALGIDLRPFLARHAAGDWQELDAFDRQQNETAVSEGLRILSAYEVTTGDGETARLWIITEADRSVTTALLAEEY